MSAEHYLRQLQAGSSAALGIPEAWRELRIRQGYADILEQIPLTVEGQEQYLREILVSPLTAALRKEERSQLSGVVVGILPIYDPNAWAFRTPGGEHLVVFHSELLGLLSYYSELQFAFARLEASNPDAALTMLLGGFRVIVDSFTGHRDYDIPPIPIDLSEEDFLKVQLKVFASEMFVLAHEFAHIMLGHTAHAGLRRVILLNSDLHIDALEWSHDQEFEADLQAIRWLSGLSADSPDPMLRFAAVAPALCVDVLVLVHIVEILGRASLSPVSHPTALSRLERIYQDASGILDNPNREELALIIQRAKGIGALSGTLP